MNEIKKLLICLSLVLLLFLAGCSHVTVSDINSDPSKYLGKKVVVSGSVSVPMEIGMMSGFMLKEGKSTLLVRSDDVHAKGESVTVKGTLVEGMFTGHYIYADSVR